MNSVVISARKLTKEYDGKTVVRSIDFDILQGECFGFLGPNGAGKTTTMRMIYCYTPITSGELRVMDIDPTKNPRKIKAGLGVVPQEDNLDPDLTVYENLRVYARYFDINSGEAHGRALELLDLFQLTEKKDAKISFLSGGMKRRLILARSMLNNPDLLVLDEPTTGLDPQARHLIWQKLRLLKQHGGTMALTTHYMDEAAELCDRLAIMDHGEIIVQGTPQELIDRFVSPETVEITLTEPGQEEHVGRILPLDDIDHELTGDTLILFPEDARTVLKTLSEKCESSLNFRHRPSTLEDVFLKLTGRELRD